MLKYEQENKNRASLISVLKNVQIPIWSNSMKRYDTDYKAGKLEKDLTQDSPFPEKGLK